MSPAKHVLLPLTLLLGACTTEAVSDDDGDGGDGGGVVDPEPQPEGLPVLGWYSHDAANVTVEVVVGPAEGLNFPRDLAFNPLVQDELWIVNHDDDSIVVASMVGQPSAKYKSFGSDHFLSHPAALAFSDNGNFATAQEEDQVTQPTTPADFMGPTLWTSNRAIFDGGHGGHLDMLHNSPNAAGIAWERDNVFWVFDGAHGALSRYDFASDHGPGGDDHSDGVMMRYVEGQVAHQPLISSHMVFDHATSKLYVAESSTGRVLVLDTTTGSPDGAVTPNYDGSQQTRMTGATLAPLIADRNDIGLWYPSGLEIHDGYLFVVDNPTSTIFAFTMEGELVDWLNLGTTEWSLQGMAFDSQGNLFVVDSLTNQVLKITPREKPAEAG